MLLLADFERDVADLVDAYFGLKEDLEVVFGRRVDLVMADAVPNAYFQGGAHDRRGAVCSLSRPPFFGTCVARPPIGG